MSQQGVLIIDGNTIETTAESIGEYRVSVDADLKLTYGAAYYETTYTPEEDVFADTTVNSATITFTINVFTPEEAAANNGFRIDVSRKEQAGDLVFENL